MGSLLLKVFRDWYDHVSVESSDFLDGGLDDFAAGRSDNLASERELRGRKTARVNE
jgi:hypothetical protein